MQENTKQISITGTNNRYMIKKLWMNGNNILLDDRKKRVNYVDYFKNMPLVDEEEKNKDYLEYEYQKKNIKDIYNSFLYEVESDIQKNYFLKTEEEIFKENYKNVLMKEISKKINNYKQQDVKKIRKILHIKHKNDIHDFYKEMKCGGDQDEKLITQFQIIQKMVDCDLKCHYCKDNVFILYDTVCETMQWTLDRINNNIGHTNENTLVSCLKCNLKRRNTNKTKFEHHMKLNNSVIIKN